MAEEKTTATGGSDQVPSFFIHADSAHFRDVHGRSLLLRGVNVTGSAKTPIGQPGSKLDGFWEGGESGEVSFVGRTFNIDNGDADVHLGRLKAWGFNTLRFIFTWEAIEHGGPKQYDHEYIAYVVHMLRKCKAYGLRVYMDPHQDLFSRFSGGSGAPYWAIIACGLNPRNFTATTAAYLECEWPSPDAPDPASFPDMIWATGYNRLAVQTLNTMFWAGRDFAPLCIIDDVNIQDYLQSHFLDACQQLAMAIRETGDLCDSCVIGWDSVNEPNEGYLGAADLTHYENSSVAILRIGPSPTAFEGMRLAMGEALKVQNWRFGPLGPKQDGHVVVDPKGKRAWLDPSSEPNGVSKWGWKRSPDWKLGTCIWAQHGIWDVDKRVILRKDYFHDQRHPETTGTNEPVNFGRDYWRPHWRAYSSTIKECHPQAIHFVHTPVFQVPPPLKDDMRALNGRACHSSHFYDGLTLVTKHWNWFNADAIGMLRGKYKSIVFAIRVGENAIRKCLREQLGVIRQDTFDQLGQLPTMMGEIGVPFDLDHKQAYSTGDYHNQARALDASLNACDGIQPLNYSVWTYTPDNSHAEGDHWNGEDLSLWSQDDAERTQKQRTGRKYGEPTLLLPDSPSRSKRVYSTAPAKDLAASETTSTASTLLTSQYPSTRSLNRLPWTISVQSDAGALASLNPSNVNLPLQVSYLDINDGARALPAFCRPYPRATIGRPVDINFDLKSSVFTLTVEVAFDSLFTSSSSLSELATEIYMPLVHYAASPRAVSQAVRNDDEQVDEPQANAAPPLSPGRHNAESLTRERTREPEGAREHPAELDLDVEVPEGTRWEASGQTLRWFYLLPTKEEGVRRYTLTAKRASGPIKTWQRQYGEDGPDTPWSSAFHDLLSCPRCIIS